MMAFILTLLKVILIDLVLSADNAVVIALACRSLPKAQQRKAYLFGSLGAVILMIALTFIAVYLLRIPYLQAIGGLLLLYIAIHLLKDDEEAQEIKQHTSVWQAVRTLILADMVMSLDNTVAVAAAARGDFLIIGIAMAVSIPLIIWGASLLSNLMNRFAFIIYVGAAILGYTSGEMIVGDRAIGSFLQTRAAWVVELLPWVMAALVLVVGTIMARKEIAEVRERWRSKRKV